jgi:peptide-methionine (S)-S-oxide reductase
VSDHTETAVLEGAAFWILQQLLRHREEVISTCVGWTGGQNDDPTVENNSSHAEAVEVVFDPKRISYRDLLELFFQIHRPDLGEHLVGSSYRSEIFYTTDEQRKVAEETILDVDGSSHWPGKVATEINEAGHFWKAEAEDQDYFQRYPDGCASSLPATRLRRANEIGSSPQLIVLHAGKIRSGIVTSSRGASWPSSSLVRALRSLFAMAVAVLLTLSSTPTANAAEAGWSFSPDSWDFGTLVPGEGPSPSKAFTLMNTGEVELQAIFVSVAGEAGAGFSLAGNTCGKLAPNAECEISVTFDPSTPGPKNGQLQVASMGGLSPPASAELSGTGAGPVVSITPEILAFEPLSLGSWSSPPKTFTIANEGQLDLTVSSISIQPNQIYNYPGAAASQFELAGGTCEAGVAVPPGVSCTVDVTFSPTAPGALTAYLKIGDDAPGAPHIAYLEGAGIETALSHHAAPRAFIVHRPARRTTSRYAVFWLRGSQPAARLACKLDDSPFKACGSSVRYHRLRGGRHRFEVRTLPTGNDPWGPPAIFHWWIEKPKRTR